MHKRVVLPILVFLLVTGCTREEEPFEARQDHVIGGTLDEGDPATVALMAEGFGFFCSGTLIAPRVVLTAAHCLEFIAAADLRIFFGMDANAGEGAQLETSEVLPHPDYDGQVADIGLVALASASTVTPATRNARPLGTELAGTDVRVVGFGTAVDGGDDSGRKRTGLVTFESVEGDYMMVRPRDGVSGCYGDSGGSNFMTFDGVEVLAGVTSFGTEESCLAGLGGNTDVQKFAAWIDEFVARVETPASCDVDGRCAEGCETPDRDCACVEDGACSDVCPDWLADDPDCRGCGAGDGCWEDCPAASPDPDCPVTPPPAPDAGPTAGADDPGDGGCGCRVHAGRSGGTGLFLFGVVLLWLRRLETRRR